MKYKDVKVLEINLVVYLGEKFKNNGWKENQLIFKDIVEKLDLKNSISWECPIEDLIYIYIDDNKDDLDPLPLESTVENIFSVVTELLEGGFIPKINILLDEFIEEGNSIDLEFNEFIEWLQKEIKDFETSK